MQTSNEAASDAHLETTPAPLVRLSDLLSAMRERRSSPENLRAAIARRFVFLRAATAKVSDHVQSLLTRRDRVREDVAVMSQVLRVRAALSADEQRSFDQLVVDYTESTLGLLVDRDDDAALAAVRRYLASVSTTMPPSS